MCVITVGVRGAARPAAADELAGAQVAQLSIGSKRRLSIAQHRGLTRHSAGGVRPGGVARPRGWIAGDSGGDLAELREIRCALRSLLAARARSTRCEYLAGVTSRCVTWRAGVMVLGGVPARAAVVVAPPSAFS